MFFWQEKRCLSEASYFFQKKNIPHLPARPRTKRIGTQAQRGRSRRFSARRIQNQAMKAITDTAAMISVARALISGDTPIRTDENTTIGKVVAPGPDTKLAITKSSSDKVNATNHPDTSAGTIAGNVITKDVFSGVQPKSMAASSMDKCTSRNRALTTTAT